jgi:hypothetical protein
MFRLATVSAQERFCDISASISPLSAGEFR